MRVTAPAPYTPWFALITAFVMGAVVAISGLHQLFAALALPRMGFVGALPWVLGPLAGLALALTTGRLLAARASEGCARLLDSHPPRQ